VNNSGIFTNVNPNLMDETNYIEYCINNILLNVNTIIPAKIVSVNGLLATIEPIVLSKPINDIPAPNPPIIPNVPIAQLMGGNAGIIIEYKPNDVVLVGVVQRDISSIKKNWTYLQPNSNRKFNLADAIVLFKMYNSLPTTYVKITDAGGVEIKCSGSQPVSVSTTGDVTTTCNNATITASGNLTTNCQTASVTATTQATVTAPTINLSGNVVISGSLTCASATIGGKDFATHEHSAGTYKDSTNVLITGRSGFVTANDNLN